MDKPFFKSMFSIKQKCLAREERIRRDLVLNPSVFHGLLSLSPDSPVPGYILAERMALSPSRASRVVSNLLDRRYIDTEFDPNDRRSQLIRLTREGCLMKEKIEERLMQCERRVLERCSDQDIRVIKWALGVLDDAL